MIILNIPSFLQSPDVQTRQYEELESALDIIHMRTMERELSLRFQDWCELSGIDYIDGLAVLQNAPEQRSTWYERTAHIDAKTQYLLAEALGEPIINREQNRKSNPLRYHPPVSLYDILPITQKNLSGIPGHSIPAGICRAKPLRMRLMRNWWKSAPCPPPDPGTRAHAGNSRQHLIRKYTSRSGNLMRRDFASASHAIPSQYPQVPRKQPIQAHWRLLTGPVRTLSPFSPFPTCRI